MRSAPDSRARRYDLVVAAATDAGYAWPAVLTLLSTARWSSAPLMCLLVGDQLGADLVDGARTVFARHGVPFTYIDGDFDRFSSLPVHSHLTRAAYGRLCVPEEARRFAPLTLYLDADTLVIGDIASLTEVELGEGRVAGAVRSRWISTVAAPGGVTDWEQRGFDSQAPFFNSGALLIDNESWLRAEISLQTVAELRRVPDNATFADQGALNGALYGQWVELPSCWNQQLARTASARVGPFVASPRSRFSLPHVRVLHYLGDVKPWEAHYPPGYPRSLYRKEWARFVPVPLPPAEGYGRWLRRRYGYAVETPTPRHVAGHAVSGAEE